VSFSWTLASPTSLPWHFTIVTLLPRSSSGAFSTSQRNESFDGIG
jgi:hypothetical protein